MNWEAKTARYPEGRVTPRRGWRERNKVEGAVRMLSSTEDLFIGHPVTDKTVVIDAPPHSLIWRWEQHLRSYARQHRVSLANFGITKEGNIAVTFRTRDDAVEFKLRWVGWEVVNPEP